MAKATYKASQFTRGAAVWNLQAYASHDLGWTLGKVPQSLTVDHDGEVRTYKLDVKRNRFAIYTHKSGASVTVFQD